MIIHEDALNASIVCGDGACHGDLPFLWKELESILTGIKKCRESGDVEGHNKYAEKLLVWRDKYPEEASAVLKVISKNRQGDSSE